MSLPADLQMFKNLRLEKCENPLFGYLNINSLRNKIVDLREIISVLGLDYFVTSETKLDSSYPSAQFKTKNYQVRGRKDRNEDGGGLIEYVKKGIICKRLKEFEPDKIESICSEITISKKKWFCMSVYRPPDYENLSTFFESITLSLSKANNKYENFLIMGDLNIDINSSGKGFNMLLLLL